MKTARFLADRSPGKPRQADLRRATSAAYYAVFHALCEEGANAFIGAPSPERTERAWKQTYRAVNPGKRIKPCEKSVNDRNGFPVGARRLAACLIELQRQRHNADYDPAARFHKNELEAYITLAEQSVSALKALPRRRKATFAALVLFQKR